MNALTAIRSFASPGLQPLPLPKPAAQPPAASPVPLEEMRDVVPLFAPQSPQGPAKTSATFGRMLEGLVHEVNAKQQAASTAVNGLLSGQNVSLHQAMIAMEEASVSFQLMAEVRNKLLESYQELMRMQI
jgi:flagellar hook-basal body complex protein FliE